MSHWERMEAREMAEDREEQLRRDRDELLAALEAVLPFVMVTVNDYGAPEALAQARDLIRRVKVTQ